MGDVIPFPISLDTLVRQLEIADQESKRLLAEVEKLKRELEDLNGELIEVLCKNLEDEHG